MFSPQVLVFNLVVLLFTSCFTLLSSVSFSASCQVSLRLNFLIVSTCVSFFFLRHVLKVGFFLCQINFFTLVESVSSMFSPRVLTVLVFKISVLSIACFVPLSIILPDSLCTKPFCIKDLEFWIPISDWLCGSFVSLCLWQYDLTKWHEPCRFWSCSWSSKNTGSASSFSGGTTRPTTLWV